MKKVFLFFIISTILCGCDPKPVREGRELYMLYLEKTFKDPSSIKIYSEKYTEDGYAVKWKIDVGGKNSYGAMVRETLEFTTIANGYKDDLLRTNDGVSIEREDLE